MIGEGAVGIYRETLQSVKDDRELAAITTALWAISFSDDGKIEIQQYPEIRWGMNEKN